MDMTATALKTVPFRNQEYQVAVSDSRSWESSLNYMVILNKQGKPIYRDDTHGNRVAILINHLYLTDQTVYMTYNNVEYIYVPRMDVIVSRASKKLCWLDKKNPQRRVMVKEAMTRWIKR